MLFFCGSDAIPCFCPEIVLFANLLSLSPRLVAKKMRYGLRVSVGFSFIFKSEKTERLCDCDIPVVHVFHDTNSETFFTTPSECPTPDCTLFLANPVSRKSGFTLMTCYMSFMNFYYHIFTFLFSSLWSDGMVVSLCPITLRRRTSS